MVVVDRMRFIVYYHGKEIFKRLQILPVNVSFISKHNHYIIFYGDRSNEQYYFNQMKNVKGFKKLEASPIYNIEANFEFKKN